MFKKKGRLSIDKLKLTNPQKEAVQKFLSAQKNKLKKLLHQAHERIHVIGDHTRNFEFWFNILGHYEYVSPACERVTGYTRDEFMKGEVLLEYIVHEDDKDRLRADKQSAIEGSSGKDVEYRFITKQGDERTMTISWVPVETRWGKHIGVRGSIMDITELKLYKNLIESLQLGSGTGESGSIAEAVFSISDQGIIASWSATAEKALGYNADSMVGSDFRLLLNDKGQTDALQGKLDQTIQTGTVDYQAWLIRNSKEKILGRIQMTRGAKGDKTAHIVCNIQVLATATKG